MGELAKIESFRRELAIAESIEEMQALNVKGELLAEMAKKLDIPLKGQNELGRTRIDLTKKLRIVIEDKFPHGGDRKSSSIFLNLKDSDIDRNDSSDAKIIKEEEILVEQIMDEIEKQDEVITPKKVAGEIRRKKKEINIEEQKRKIKSGEMSLPEGIFDIIVVDPPWPYERKYDPDTSRSANPYPEMSIEEITNIKLTPDENCILWLWTTHRFIWDAKNIMNLWGFEYKGILVWDKEKMGMGNWLRMQCEFCLLGIKGKPLWDVKDLRDIITESRTTHSSKPEGFYKMVDDNFISKNKFKADYFGRKEREGWKIKK